MKSYFRNYFTYAFLQNGSFIIPLVTLYTVLAEARLAPEIARHPLTLGLVIALGAMILVPTLGLFPRHRSIFKSLRGIARSEMGDDEKRARTRQVLRRFQGTMRTFDRYWTLGCGFLAAAAIVSFHFSEPTVAADMSATESAGKLALKLGLLGLGIGVYLFRRSFDWRGLRRALHQPDNLLQTLQTVRPW